MGLFSSAPKPPVATLPPQNQTSMFQSETAQMTQITRTANHLAVETFNALNSARTLMKNPRLSSHEHGKVSEAKELLKTQSNNAKYSAEELRCFNRTFDRIATQLGKLAEHKSSQERMYLNEENLRTKEGYSPEWLRQEVVHHRQLQTDFVSRGYPAVNQAVQQFNEVANARGLPPISDLPQSWQNAASPASR